ncbi:sensor histidine kinase [Sulfurospirillum arcachonense]|uniref:sensor histidine kinase n=1 Tax=Sulfurospirillum arcachonense TaxID=57666 RepID=UPI001FDFB3DA|nr:ATP-binding protein [Sulfurospirillum arcachonense]
MDKLKTTLRVIVLDVADDIVHHKNELHSINFNEENEYKFEPLYFRLLKVSDSLETISSLTFPKNISSQYSDLKFLKQGTITFEHQNHYVISRVKIDIKNIDYVIEVATNQNYFNNTLENLLYILFFIVPIVLILSTTGGYFLIYKSFLPINEILMNLKKINATDLSKRLETLDNNDEIDLLSKEINSLLSRLEISFDKISQFSSDASHELKTPLTIIRGEIEVGLRKERTTQEYKEILENNLEEILIIQRTIDDLLFLAKSEEPLNSNSKELIYLDEVTLEAINELKSFAKLKNVSIEYEIKDAMQMQGHSKLLKVAIKNIIKNAILFSHENENVIVENYIKDEKYIISIQDFGIGIPQKEHKKIFEKFYRTDKSRNKNSGGTGLGMAICEKIVTLHGGKVELQSKENEGTIVTFAFFV